ncbi:MAG: NAD(P)/FAD-dependent oxidoreductase [Deltaproteobacteria bacterium]|nr:NAD(P)/FAD-dependent oxidoreductase [Deltaproteobacteria bacterium]MBN2673776.1 NAD(P)/FAD-dependent oxidoreductase [Deltaproteobacteria bacterium]
MKCDVCIIGAGPAGLFCALRLVQAGAAVVLVEKSQIAGTKSCGGGLTPRAFQLVCDELGLNVESMPVQFEPQRRLQVCSEYGRTTIEQLVPYMYVGDKRWWLTRLSRRLQEQGGRVLMGRRCRDIAEGEVRLTDGTQIATDYIVAADGPRSLIRKKLHLPNGASVMARQIVVSRSVLTADIVDWKQPAVWFDYNRFGAGYAWSFPFQDDARIGCCVPRMTHSNQQLNRAFFDWLRTLNLSAESGKLESGSIGCEYVGHRLGRIFLVGDAAGLASPVTGEGIFQAMVSGEEVAREILTPGYYSTPIAELSMRHHRVFNLLTNAYLGGALYQCSAQLLRVPSVARKAMAIFS